MTTQTLWIIVAVVVVVVLIALVAGVTLGRRRRISLRGDESGAGDGATAVEEKPRQGGTYKASGGFDFSAGNGSGTGTPTLDRPEGPKDGTEGVGGAAGGLAPDTAAPDTAAPDSVAPDSVAPDSAAPGTRAQAEPSDRRPTRTAGDELTGTADDVRTPPRGMPAGGTATEARTPPEGIPVVRVPDTATPADGIPATPDPDAAGKGDVPATAAPDTATPDTAAPDTVQTPATTAPGPAEPGTAEPGTAEPGTADPGAPEPVAGTTGSAPAVAATAAAGTAEAGVAAAGIAAAGLVGAAPTTAPTTAPATAPTTPADIDPAEGRLERLRGNLSRSRSAFGQSLLGLLGGGELDEESWEDVEATLLQADLGPDTTAELVDTLRTELAARAVRTPEQARALLREVLTAALDTGLDRSIRALPHDGRPGVLLIVGVNGTGKTTTTGKLARVLVAGGRTVVLGAADTFRAAAAEQLETWGERAGAAVVRGAEGADPAAVAFDAVKRGTADGVDAVILDTAGRLHTKTGLMDELGKVKRVVEKQTQVDEVILVLDATTGQNGMVQARVFGEVVEVTGIALTKLDGTAKGGIVFRVQRELGVPVKLVGLGEGPDDLAPFEPQAFVDALLS